jgi:rubrerythrin
VESRFFPPGTIAPVRTPTLFADNAGLARAGDEVQVLRADGTTPLHDPPLEPRDEAVFLLTAAAEVEHALMVQYLYAAYSVRVRGPNAAELQKVQDLLLQVAREEMGHLITVQNLLHLVGGPLNLGRDRAPYTSEIDPFRFTLEPLTLDSLAKYVTAESPSTLPDGMSPADKALVGQIALDAAAANGGNAIRHVGAIFLRLSALFGDATDGLADTDFRTDTGAQQASRDDWGFAPLNPVDGSPLLVDSFPGTDVAALRLAARAAIDEIAEQGEGFDLPPAGPDATESHFERFLDIYKRVASLTGQVTWPVATNPNTSPQPHPAVTPVDPLGSAMERHAADGRITEPRARAWAQLFDLRYRMLLGQLAHFLRLDQEVYTSAAGPQQGDRTARGLLLLGAFDEMRHLKKIATKLVQLPKTTGATVHAGPPFELPYTLSLPDGEAARWRMHLDASRAAGRLVGTLQELDPDPFLAALATRDADTRTVLVALAAGAAIPTGSLPAGFAKAVTILEEAVHGFRVRCRHGSFWAGTTRDEFVTTLVPPVDLPPVALDQAGAVVPNSAEAQLLQRLTAPDERDRMPRFRAAVPAPRLAYLARWINDGAPDDDPAGRVGVTAEPDPKDEPTTPPPDPLSFATHIAGLFRPGDRDAMSFMFDLASFTDVRDNAESIFDQVDSGDMPCDAPWPPERVTLFRRWIDEGMRP